jgi:transcriptional regulator with XRE-family HTH domain
MAKKNLHTFGDELRCMRLAKELTLADLADAIGSSIVYVSDIERNRRNPPSFERIEQLMTRLGELKRLPEMLALAARTRRSIEIPVDDKTDDVATMLVALARRVDEGTLDPAVVKKIRTILEE